MSLSRVILEPRATENSSAMIEYALRRGFRRFLFSGGSIPAGLPMDAETTIQVGTTLRSASGKDLGSTRQVRDPKDLEAAGQRLTRGDLVLVDFEGESIIPLENLIAHAGRKGTLWVRTMDLERVPSALGALEAGSDAVVCPVGSVDDLTRLEGLIEGKVPELIWRQAVIDRLGPGGMGERVIVDSTSLLGESEGLLAGSQGAFLFHVVGETQGSRYTRPRPFRVNAGALHSYTLLASGETRYLSELEPGDAVVIATPRGTTRSARVGRLKIERRPMTLLEVTVEGTRYTVFVQEAETVRLTGEQGPVPVTDLRVGMKLWGVSLPKARHFGKTVAETIVER